MTKLYTQAIARNSHERVMFEETMEMAEYLLDVLGLRHWLKEVRIERMNGWGSTDASYAGLYRPSQRLVKVNVRTLYGATRADCLRVLAHEMRHAYQDKNEMFKFTGRRQTNHHSVYLSLPYEVDAREYERVYLEMFAKHKGVDLETLYKYTLPGDRETVWDYDNQVKELRNELNIPQGQIGIITGRDHDRDRTFGYITVDQINERCQYLKSKNNRSMPAVRSMTNAAWRRAWEYCHDVIESQVLSRQMRVVTLDESLAGYSQDDKVEESLSQVA